MKNMGAKPTNKKDSVSLPRENIADTFHSVSAQSHLKPAKTDPR